MVRLSLEGQGTCITNIKSNKYEGYPQGKFDDYRSLLSVCLFSVV